MAVRSTSLRPSSSRDRRPRFSAFALSPDGRRIVFAGVHSGKAALYVRALDRPEATVVAGTDDAANPFFSPDGRWVGFVDGAAIKKVSVDGGPVTTIADLASRGASSGEATPSGGDVYGASWGDGDRIVVGRFADGLFEVSASGGLPRRLTKVEGRGRRLRPSPSPGPPGRPRHPVHAVPQPGRRLRRRRPHGVRRGAGPRRVRRGRPLPAHRPSRLLPRGRASRRGLRPGAARPPRDGGADPGRRHAGDGKRRARPQQRRGPVRLVGQRHPCVRAGWRAAADLVESGLARSARTDGGPEPARRLLLAAAPFPRRPPDRRDPHDGRATRPHPHLGPGHRARSLQPACPAKGSRVPCGARTASGCSSGASIPPASTGPARTARASPSCCCPRPRTSRAGSTSPDGSVLAYVDRTPETNQDIWVLPLAAEGKPRPWLKTSASENQPELSPDGRWMAYASNVSGRCEVYVQPFPGPEGSRYQVSLAGGQSPRWSRDGRELFFVTDARPRRLLAVDVHSSPAFTAEPAA